VFDLAHRFQAECLPNAGWINAVFRWQHHRDQQRCGVINAIAVERNNLAELGNSARVGKSVLYI
jgi:hypothetical protein